MAESIALKRPISSDTDGNGSTEGWSLQTFDTVVESKPNTVFLHGREGEPVECAILEDIIPEQDARELVGVAEDQSTNCF
ncbi:hypothetical protein ACHAWF_001086 [Thalassiosira exigua]